MKTISKCLSYFLLIPLMSITTLSLAQIPIPTVEIHQIDIGVGDAALINVNSDRGKISILLDAGLSDADWIVLPYLQEHAKKVDTTYTDDCEMEVNEVIYLDYIIASHYHNDHIGGLIGKKKPYYIERPTLRGGTKREFCEDRMTGIMGKTDPPVYFFALLDKGDSPPKPKNNDGLLKKYKKLAGNRRITIGSTFLDDPDVVNTIRPPMTFPPPVPGTDQELSLGGYIDLGQDSQGVPIRMHLILANARIYYPSNIDPPMYDAARAKRIVRANRPVKKRNLKARPNANNWGVGWVLEYGEFRYYTAGDVGGHGYNYTTCVSCDAYFDIETPISKALPQIFPGPVSSPGHVCVQKVSHHGSCCSTNEALLDVLRSTVSIISCGQNKDYDHPQQLVMDRLEQRTWPGIDSLFFSRTDKYIMTELYFQNREIDLNYGKTSGNVSLVATQSDIDVNNIRDSFEMNNGDYLYQLEDDYHPYVKGNTIIKVFERNAAGHSIADYSHFELIYKDYDGREVRIPYNCHQ